MTTPQGYLTMPETAVHPPFLLLPAWWGLNNTIRAFCDQLAAEGHIAFAPDLYDGAIATTIAEAETLSEQMDVKGQRP